jgi:hypothetical protein
MAINFPDSPSDNDIYTVNGKRWIYSNGKWSIYGTTAPDATASDTAPTGVGEGHIWYKSDTSQTLIRYDSTWVELGAVSQKTGMTHSATAPSSPVEGELWYDTDNGRVYTYYNDGSSTQWVEFGTTPSSSSLSLESYADSTARDTAIPSPVEGDLVYLQDTNSVLFYDGSSWSGFGKVKKVEAFTASGTWTVPAGVTYAIAHIRGGGGNVRINGGTTGQGGSSSVAFASGTVTATGGYGVYVSGSGGNIVGGGAVAGQANSGHGAHGWGGKATSSENGQAEDGALIVAGADVTPAASITVTVGAGGTGSGGDTGADGGSGYVWIEYQV